MLSSIIIYIKIDIYNYNFKTIFIFIKVWKIKVDLSVLNMDGNTLGCCSIATLAALMHFRYPDVVSTGEKVIVYSSSERDPIPLSLHHYPIISSFAIFEK